MSDLFPGLAKVALSSQNSRGGSTPGERRGGRKAGTPNRATADVRVAAESEAAQVAACREILDRAHGRPAQAIIGDPERPVDMVTHIELVVVDPQTRRHEANGDHSENGERR
jgi:hypothetical protein